MELILKTDDEDTIAKIINFANELHVPVEKRELSVKTAEEREVIWQRLMNFKQTGPPSIVDPAVWEREQREDRELPFSH